MKLNSSPYIQPSESHFTRKNEREWNSDQIAKFIQDELGADLVRPIGPRVLLMRPFAPEKTQGGLIIPQDAREDAVKDVHIGKVIDFGNEAFLDSDRFPLGCTINRGDWVFYQAYEHRRIPVGKEKDYELLIIYDDKIIAKTVNNQDLYTPRR